VFEIDSIESNIRYLFIRKIFILYQQLEIFFVSDEEPIRGFYQAEMMV
jgi:hypothetical protein